METKPSTQALYTSRTRYVCHVVTPFDKRHIYASCDQDASTTTLKDRRRRGSCIAWSG